MRGFHSPGEEAAGPNAAIFPEKHSLTVHNHSGWRRIEKMRLVENTSRVLNLIALEKLCFGQPSEPASKIRPAALPQPATQRFFLNEFLNRAIFLKHNIRADEKSLFDDHGHVETKILIPFDGTRLELGARSFFIGERAYAEVLRNFLRIDPAGEDEKSGRDLKVLEVLRKIPSFDPFILRESLRAAGISVDRRYFEASYNEMEAATDAVYSDIKPLIESALGQTATKEQLERFIEQVWNVTEESSTNLFFETLRIPRSEWPEIVFAWKALLFYRMKTRTEDNRLAEVVTAMKQIRLSNNINMCSAKDLHKLKQHLAHALFRLQKRALKRAESVSHALVSAISVDFELMRFREILRKLSTSIVALGTDVTVFEQVVSYYMYLFGQKGCYADGVLYETTLRSLDEIVSLRFAA